MDPTFWSEYKITFCEPTNCIMNYIISKGYVYQHPWIKSFTYNQFNNYFSHDLDKRLIGLKDLSVHRGLNVNTESNTMLYMSETFFNRINNELEQISQTDIDNLLLSTKKEFMIKRGILVHKREGHFTITMYGKENGLVSGIYEFGKHQGYKFCTLDLVRIKNNDSEGFIPVPSVPIPNLIDL
jgi:hypothetical protein